MDLFKLIYEHDLRLDALRKRHSDRDTQDINSSLEAFLKPDPTYSKFYFTGTRPDTEQFGLNTLAVYNEISDVLQAVFEGKSFFAGDIKYTTLQSAIDSIEIGQAILITQHPIAPVHPSILDVGVNSNVGHMKEELADVLTDEDWVLYKEQAHNGFDLHLFSRKNIYRDFFYPFQEMVNENFRFFSMNGKKIRSERHFYFETWTLERPPHGTEEVFKETVL